MQFMVYGTRPSKDKSGAYLFLPDGKAKVFSQMFSSHKSLIKSLPCGLCHFIMLGELRAERRCCFISLTFKTTQYAGVSGICYSARIVLLNLLGGLLLLNRSLNQIVLLTQLAIPLVVLLSALPPERITCGARCGGASLLRGGGSLPAFPADHSHPQRAR